MPLTLLPASAQAFAPRSAPNIVLGSRPEAWLTQALKRINKIRRPLNSVTQHLKTLTDLLSQPSALWLLASVTVPKKTKKDWVTFDDPDPQFAAALESFVNEQMIHIEGYVVHVDMVSQNEIAYKLTQESIDSLVKYHKDIYSVDSADMIYDWPDKQKHLEKLREDFVQAVNRFVFRCKVRALDGLEEDGSGELLDGFALEARNAILGLLVPLSPPPPPQIAEIIGPAPVVMDFGYPGHWYPMIQVPAMPMQQHHLTPPQDPWRVLGSSPSPMTRGHSICSSWSNSGMTETHLPSPAPSVSIPYISAPYPTLPPTSAPQYSSPQPLPQSSLPPLPPLPSTMLSSQQCGYANHSMGNYGLGNYGYGGFNQNYHDMSHQNAIFI